MQGTSQTEMKFLSESYPNKDDKPFEETLRRHPPANEHECERDEDETESALSIV
jgi:hypothetical protein